MKLYKSDVPHYRYVVEHNDWFVYIGHTDHLTYPLVCDKRRLVYLSSDDDRTMIKRDYLETIDQSRLDRFNTKEALECFLLYNKPTLKASIKDYTQRFGVYLQNYHKVEFDKRKQ